MKSLDDRVITALGELMFANIRMEMHLESIQERLAAAEKRLADQATPPTATPGPSIDGEPGLAVERTG